MYEIKYEQLKILSVCCGCLSSKRTLYKLNENANIFQRICEDFCLDLQELLFCWECTALLKKIRKFQKRIRDVQQNLYILYTNEQDSANCLSSLSINTTSNVIYMKHEYGLANIKDLKEEPDYIDDLKEEPDYIDDDSIQDNTKYADLGINIKEENEADNHTPMHENYTENNQDDDCYRNNMEEKTGQEKILPADEPKKTNKRKLLKIKHYKYLYNKMQKGMRLVKKVKLSHDEVMTGIEEQRCDYEYQNAKYKCSFCVYGFKLETWFKDHNRKYHEKVSGPYVCDICQSRFQNKELLASHIKGHYYILVCKLCGIRHNRKWNMRVHIEKHKKTVQCLICDACFGNARLFYEHYKALHSVFLCDVCGKKCLSKYVMEKHIRKHIATRCDICNVNFKNRISLIRHKHLKHVVTAKEDSYCVQCDRQFINRINYRRHLLTSVAHAPERKQNGAKKKIPCPECGNLYSRKTYMMNHYRYVHVNQSKYYCQDCDKQFLNRTKYVDHVKYKHEGIQKEKNKVCNICGRGFATNRILLNHVRTHSGERPYGCEYCDAKFIQKHAMQYHVKHIHLKCKRRNWQE